MTLGMLIIVSIILIRTVYRAAKNASVQYEDESGFYDLGRYLLLSSEKDKKKAA